MLINCNFRSNYTTANKTLKFGCNDYNDLDPKLEAAAKEYAKVYGMDLGKIMSQAGEMIKDSTYAGSNHEEVVEEVTQKFVRATNDHKNRRAFWRSL